MESDISVYRRTWREEVGIMGILNADVFDKLVHSSTISKGIERTMDMMIKELGIDSMYVIHYEEDIMEPELAYDYEVREDRPVGIEEYIDFMEEQYHFDRKELYVARATTVLPPAEKAFYERMGYGAVAEYQMRNHGKVAGYIIMGWQGIKELTDDEERELYVLLKCMNEMLLKQFYKELVGESNWRLFKLAAQMTQTLLYMIDEDYRIQYMNTYAKEAYPNIHIGDYCYRGLCNETKPCKDCKIHTVKENECIEDNVYMPHLEGTFRMALTKIKMLDGKYSYVLTMQRLENAKLLKQRDVVGRKFIAAMQNIYKDIIVVELRRDTFFNLFKADRRYSYSMDFVLKWLSKLHLDDKQKFIECFDINFLQEAYANGESIKEIDFRYRTHEGTYHCMNGKIIFEQNTNKEVTVYILFQDVEQMRSVQIEEQRQIRDSLLAARSAAELKGQILENISHEIRTPMSGILSMSSVARQIYEDKDRLLECLSNIDDYAEHMMKVMDALLEAVRVDEESITITPRPFRLERFLERFDIAVRKKIEKKNAEFSIKANCQYQMIIGDEIRLQQVLFYLMDNVISYTPVSGVIRFEVKQVAADSKQVFIRFTIENTGNGMTERMKEGLFGFSEGQQMDMVVEQHFDLSLAAKLIQLMGGQIGLVADGEGTKLHFTLPFGLQAEVKGKQMKQRKNMDADRFSGRRILLAEDSDMANDAIRAVLEVVGFQVDSVENGRKAVIQFVSQPAHTYDAVLMDVHMPYMDGREATKCIRISGKEDGDTIPIIGLMANTYEGDREESLKAGMQEHLAKPVDVDTLYRVLEKVIPDEED